LLADCSTRFCDRTNCKHCQNQLHGKECFPSQLSYSAITASSFWQTQPHEQIITTVTQFRNEMSVPLSVLSYADVSSRLIFFDDQNKNGTYVSHVAILNHTVLDHREGAFCLLLYQPSNSKHFSFHRLSYLPALLPNVGELTYTNRKEKILIPGPVLGHGTQNGDTIFIVPGDSYRVRAWNARGVTSRSILRTQESLDTGLKNAELKVQAGEKDLKGQAEVSCRVSHGQNFDGRPQILVKLEGFAERCMWSIKEVSEVKCRGRLLKQRTLFRPSTLSDRCKVHLSDGTQLYIGLRRAAAANHRREVGPVRQQRYHIFFQPA
jgi:hypothetical protein